MTMANHKEFESQKCLLRQGYIIIMMILYFKIDTLKSTV